MKCKNKIIQLNFITFYKFYRIKYPVLVKLEKGSL